MKKTWQTRVGVAVLMLWLIALGARLVYAQDTTSLLSAFLVNLRNGTIQLTATTQGNLGTVVNGQIKYCSDCTIASPCAGGGTGALAKGLNNAWVCN